MELKWAESGERIWKKRGWAQVWNLGYLEGDQYVAAEFENLVTLSLWAFMYSLLVSNGTYVMTWEKGTIQTYLKKEKILH